MKIWSLKQLLGEKDLDFAHLRSILRNLVHPRENAEKLIFPGEHLNFTPINFEIITVILLRQSLVSGRVSVGTFFTKYCV